MKIDLKSAVVGAIAGAGLILVVGAATEPQHPGRYQMVVDQNEAIVIDTATGELTKRHRSQIKVPPTQRREQKLENE
jgi:hypothetical protein